MTRFIRRRAVLLTGFVCTSLAAFADPPTSETVLRPGTPSSARFYIEPHLGLNFTLMSADSAFRAQIPGEGDLDIYRSASGLALLGGVTFGLQLSPTSGIELDVAFDSRRASNSGNTEDGCERIDLSTGQVIGVTPEPASKEYTIGADYVSLGLAGTFVVEEFFFYIGPTISIPIAQTIDETMQWSLEDSECRYFFGTTDETKVVVSTVLDETGVAVVDAATRVSLRFGAGGAIPLGDRMALVPRVAFDLGLTNTYQTTGNSLNNYTLRKEGTNSANFLGTRLNDAINLSSLQASLGIRFTM